MKKAFPAYSLDDTDIWMNKEWNTEETWPASQEKVSTAMPGTIMTTIPEGTAAWYSIVETEDGLTASSTAVLQTFSSESIIFSLSEPDISGHSFLHP